MFPSKMCSQSASVMLSKGLVSNMPRLWTRMSASAKRSSVARVPSAVPRSAARPSRFPETPALLRAVRAWSTRFVLRPFTVRDAPSFGKPFAIAKPMPAAEPVTSACFPSSCRFNFVLDETSIARIHALPFTGIRNRTEISVSKPSYIVEAAGKTLTSAKN